MIYAEPLETLINEFKKLPGIGSKSAQRIVFHLLKIEKEQAAKLPAALLDVLAKIRYCQRCNNFAADETCLICSDSRREQDKLCVVEEPFNIYSIEKTGLYNGLYYVLMGNLSPLRGIGPEQLKISRLVQRVQEEHFNEIIIATSSTVEGNATAHYLTEILRNYKIKLTRIAQGLPVGSDLDYVDQVTIARALEGRFEIK